jgi:hypothetical protein
MLQLEVLVRKLVTIDGFPSRPVTIGKVTTLDHELFDDSVEARALIPKAFLSSCEGTEVIGRLKQMSDPEHVVEDYQQQTLGTVLP